MYSYLYLCHGMDEGVAVTCNYVSFGWVCLRKQGKKILYSNIFGV